jgi:argininosuccinate synthase
MTKSTSSPRTIVLAYSGGLDTSVILTWLREEYHAKVVACYVNVGQKEDTTAIRKKSVSHRRFSIFRSRSSK